MILPDKLRSFDYYRKKIPMYLRQSQGFEEHFKLWYDLMMGDSMNEGVVKTAEALLEMLNIYDTRYNDINDYVNNYFENLRQLGIQAYEDRLDLDILDKLASVFAISRNLAVQYYDSEGIYRDEVLYLTNKELLMYILSKIIQSHCDGTRQQLQKLYSSIGLKVIMTNGSSSARVEYRLVLDENVTYSRNTIALFLSGNLIVKQLGSEYVFGTVNNSATLIWATNSDTGTQYLWGGDNVDGGLWL